MLLDREVERAGAFEVGIHAECGDVILDGVEIRHAERVEAIEFFRPPALSVLSPVGQARVDETAVASGCRPADRFGLQQHDLSGGVAARRPQGGPQPGVAAADDGQVGFDVARELRMPGPGSGILQPEHRVPRSRPGRDR